MIKNIAYLFIVALIFPLYIYAQTFNKNAFLKDYSEDLIITTQVRGERNKAILRGTEAKKNREFVLQNYNGIQPSIYPAWDNGFWPSKKPASVNNIKIQTSGLDELVNWGEINNFHIIHHCLFFPNKYFPKWFSNTKYSKNELETLMEIYIDEVLNSNNNKDKVDVFNLINEIFAMNKSGHYRISGNGKENCKWMDMGFEKDQSRLEGRQKINKEHPIFVRKAFEYASKITNAKLEIRDFNIAFGGGKSDGMYQLIKHLKNLGVKIDAVGFQCHLNADGSYNYNDLKENILRFIELGVEVYITELDVGLNLWSNDGNHKKVSDVIKSSKDWKKFFELQNEVYYKVVKTAKDAGVSLISDWGFRDDIPYGGWRKDQKAWMVNKNYTRKGAYHSVLRALFDSSAVAK